MNPTTDRERPGLTGGRVKSPGGEEPVASLTADQAAGSNLDKVRDILFGAQSREYERRIATFEERLVKESADLRNDLKRRFDSLELYIKKEIEAVTDRIKSEQGERSEALKELGRELKDIAKTVEKKTAQLEDHAAKAQRELRQQILDQSKTLIDEIEQKQTHQSAALDQAIQLLRNEKTDRASLAALFMEVSMRLNNEFRIPTGE